MIRLGAYREGSDAGVDEAIHYYPALEAFLGQPIEEQVTLEDGYQALSEIIDLSDGEDGADAEPTVFSDDDAIAAMVVTPQPAAARGRDDPINNGGS